MRYKILRTSKETFNMQSSHQCLSAIYSVSKIICYKSAAPEWSIPSIRLVCTMQICRLQKIVLCSMKDQRPNQKMGDANDLVLFLRQLLWKIGKHPKIHGWVLGVQLRSHCLPIPSFEPSCMSACAITTHSCDILQKSLVNIKQTKFHQWSPLVPHKPRGTIQSL